MAVAITVMYPASTKYPSCSRYPNEIKRIPYDGKKSPNGAIIGVTNKIAPNDTIAPLKCLILLLSTRMLSLGFITFSIGVKMFKSSFKIRLRSCFDMWRFMKRLGIKIGLLNPILILNKNMAVPKGILLPGIETGSKNGAVKIIQDIKSPRSPIISRNSSKVIPSSGIFEEISSDDQRKMFNAFKSLRHTKYSNL